MKTRTHSLAAALLMLAVACGARDIPGECQRDIESDPDCLIDGACAAECLLDDSCTEDDVIDQQDPDCDPCVFDGTMCTCWDPDPIAGRSSDLADGLVDVGWSGPECSGRVCPSVERCLPYGWIKISDPDEFEGTDFYYRSSGEMFFRRDWLDYNGFCGGSSYTRSWGAENPEEDSCTPESVPWGTQLP